MKATRRSTMQYSRYSPAIRRAARGRPLFWAAGLAGRAAKARRK